MKRSASGLGPFTPPGTRKLHNAYEAWIPRDTSPAFLTCDHASARLPAPLRWPAQDLDWVGTHWSYDLGARALADALSQRLSAPLVSSRFTRLLVDPNREPTQDSFIVRQIQTTPLKLNSNLAPEQLEWRRDALHTAYHRAIDQALTQHKKKHSEPLLLSIHTFTPVYQGQPRPMHGGVLFDAQDELAKQLCAGLVRLGWRFEENAPYSGYAGLIHGIAQHGRAHNCRYLELEVRQDLAVHPHTRARIADSIAQVCETLL